MNVLIIGSGKGSWQMRGVQLGAALGARVSNLLQPTDLRWADVVVLIKRAITQFGPTVAKAGKPIVWDALDFWSQPVQNTLRPDQAMSTLRRLADPVKPALIIGATQAMADACGGVYLPHHSWAGLSPLPVREQVQTVAYEGNPVYLGNWLRICQRACEARGWRFVVNPTSLAEADLIVALRNGPWDGWICREWKSGVKLVNAIAAGRPVMTQDSAAWRELSPAGSPVDNERELMDEFDRWSDFSLRAVAHAAASDRYRVESVADHYRTLLSGVLTCA